MIPTHCTHQGEIMDATNASNYAGKGSTKVDQQGETKSVYGSTIDLQRRAKQEPDLLTIPEMRYA
jgi:hypothetical protein